MEKPNTGYVAVSVQYTPTYEVFYKIALRLPREIVVFNLTTSETARLITHGYIDNLELVNGEIRGLRGSLTAMDPEVISANNFCYIPFGKTKYAVTAKIVENGEVIGYEVVDKNLLEIIKVKLSDFDKIQGKCNNANRLDELPKISKYDAMCEPLILSEGYCEEHGNREYTFQTEVYEDDIMYVNYGWDVDVIDDQQPVGHLEEYLHHCPMFDILQAFTVDQNYVELDFVGNDMMCYELDFHPNTKIVDLTALTYETMFKVLSDITYGYGAPDRINFVVLKKYREQLIRDMEKPSMYYALCLKTYLENSLNVGAVSPEVIAAKCNLLNIHNSILFVE